MAVTWNVEIVVQDVDMRKVNVTATRTDDADPVNPQICAVIDVIIATAEQKMAVLNALWAQHLAKDERKATIANFIGNLEADAKTNLEARET